ncbi:MAG TPA: hypothetical protein PL070_16135 [Flavobacteriales bacterium]|nr:hypothetical protein [Flavobacteriales bacterium]
MKWELDDNTSDGIRFLLVGTGSLLVLRLAYAGIQRVLAPETTDALAMACTPFHHGYWLTNAHTLVQQTDGGIGTRLALGVTISVVVALVLAGLVHLLTRLFGSANGTWTLRTLRLAMIVPFCWWLYAALLVPPTQASIGPEGIVQRQRSNLLGELSLPWGSSSTTIPWNAIEAFAAKPADDGVELRVTTPTGSLVLAQGAAADVEALVQELQRYRAER